MKTITIPFDKKENIVQKLQCHSQATARDKFKVTMLHVL